MKLRAAELDDARLLLRWRNDPTTRQQSFNTSEVELDAHEAWLGRKLADKATRVYIFEVDGAPVGQARIDTTGAGEGEISVSVDAAARGRGLGSELIARATKRGAAELRLARVLANIKEGNVASRRAFKTAGYEPYAEGPGTVTLCWRA